MEKSMSNIVPDPSRDISVLDRFCEYLSTNICVLELYLSARKIGNREFDPKANDPLILPVEEGILRQSLDEWNYLNLIRDTFSRVRISPKTLDIYKSQLDDNLVNLFCFVIEQQSQKFSIEKNPQGYIYSCPALISDSLLPVISSFHTEIVATAEQFLELRKALGGNVGQIFLHAKGSTAKSQFIQMWVAHHVGLTTGDLGGDIAVI